MFRVSAFFNLKDDLEALEAKATPGANWYIDRCALSRQH